MGVHNAQELRCGVQFDRNFQPESQVSLSNEHSRKTAWQHAARGHPFTSALASAESRGAASHTYRSIRLAYVQGYFQSRLRCTAVHECTGQSMSAVQQHSFLLQALVRQLLPAEKQPGCPSLIITCSPQTLSCTVFPLHACLQINNVNNPRSCSFFNLFQSNQSNSMETVKNLVAGASDAVASAAQSAKESLTGVQEKVGRAVHAASCKHVRRMLVCMP